MIVYVRDSVAFQYGIEVVYNLHGCILKIKRMLEGLVLVQERKT